MSRPTDSTRADARTITIAVTFFADLRRFLPRGAEGPQRYTVPEGATAADLLAAIGVEPGAEVTIAVDGELGNRETPLRDGSDVMLLNPMEGGAAAEGEATNQNIGGAAARWRSLSRRRGDQQDGRGIGIHGPLRLLEQDPARESRRPEHLDRGAGRRFLPSLRRRPWSHRPLSPQVRAEGRRPPRA